MHSGQKILEPYVIAETAYNHEGDLQYLKRMIIKASELEISAIKFHVLMDIDSYFQNNHPLREKLSPLLFSESQWDEIISLSSKRGLDIIILCDDIHSLDFVLKRQNEISAIEIHAVSINEVFMLKKVCSFDGEVILGIGGCSLDEIEFAVHFLEKHGQDQIILMYGFQNYPTNYQEISISKMIKIRDLFNREMGYADHTSYDDERNIQISTIAAANGFNVLEKHFTLDEGIQRLDFHAAVGEEKMQKIVDSMRVALEAYGDNSLKMSESEKKYGQIGPMKKAIVAKRDIEAGEKLALNKLCFKRTNRESYIEQRKIFNLLGSSVNQTIKQDEIIDYSRIEYSFKKLNEKDFTNIDEKK